MFISDNAIKKPTLTVVAMMILVVFGLVALFQLDTDEYPEIDAPVVVVAIPYPGASPDNVEREVIDPIEEEISGISGIDRMIGRHYSGKVTQVISGSIGYDDWEWGVDLFAPDPLVFKKLIYEMRFDEASAKFAEFGPFYTGLQFDPAQLSAFLSGAMPNLE